MRRYVHYGAPSYDPELFQAVNNGGYHNKPKGGLWLSPVDAEKGWDKWCQLAEHPVHNAGEPGTSFEIEIADDVRWLKLATIADVEGLPYEDVVLDEFELEFAIPGLTPTTRIDWVAIARDYDVVDVPAGSNRITKLMMPAWDCDTTLVLNKEVIRPCL